MRDNREQELVNELRIKGKMELAEVMEWMKISESTARRLFARLEKEGKVIRVHGGIQLPGRFPAEYSFDRLAQSHLKEKSAIAGKACEILEDGDVIFCDAGTTVLCFCVELARRMEQNPIKLQVYTNSLANFEVLVSCVPITLIGGEYRSHRRDFSGYLAEEALKKIHFTRCFLGTDGSDRKQYFTTTDFATARLDEIVMDNSDETAILCASDKFSTCAQVRFASFEAVDRVITDEGVSAVSRKKLEEFGIRLTIAK